MMNLLHDIISENLVNALGWTLLHSLWQGLVIGLMLLILLFFYRDHSPRIRYNLSVFSLFMIFILGITTFLIIVKSNPGLTGSHSAYLNTADNLPVLTKSTQKAFQGFHDNYNILNFISVVSNNFPIIICLWLLGVFLITLRMTGGFLLSLRLKRSGLTNIAVSLQARFDRLVSRMRIRKNIKIFQSERTKVPLVIGYFKPMILLPVSAITLISCEQLESIIAHELAHIRRHDYLVNICQSIVETLFFYNPAVWFIGQRIRKERELCCDDIAITYSAGPVVYARAMASIHEIPCQAGFPALAINSGSKYLFYRVFRILKIKKMKTNLTDRIMAGLVMISAIILILLSTGASFNKALKDPLSMNPGTDILFSTGNPGFQNPVNITGKDSEYAAFDVPSVTAPVLEESITNLPNIIPNSHPDKWYSHLIRQDTALKVKDNTVQQTFMKDGKEMEMRMVIRKGKVTELYINGEKIPEKDFSKYQEEIDQTLNELDKMHQQLAEARQEIAKMDMEKLSQEIEESLAEIKEIDMKKIQLEREKFLAEIQEIDTEKIQKEMQESLKEIEEIDLKKIQLEIEKALSEVKEIDMEELRKEMQIAIASAREEMKDIQFDIPEDLELELEKVKKELQDIDTEKMLKEIQESLSDVKIEIDKEKIKRDLEEAGKEMDDMLKELEKLELEKK